MIKINKMNIDYCYFYDNIYVNKNFTKRKCNIINQLINNITQHKHVTSFNAPQAYCFLCDVEYELNQSRYYTISFRGAKCIIFCHLCYIHHFHYAYQHIKQISLEKMFQYYSVFKHTSIYKSLIADVNNYIFMLMISN